MPPNTAAWLTGPKAYPLEVKSAPYTSPGDNEIVIKNGAVAINPIDWIKQDTGSMVYPWIKYPFVIGTDVAGEVVEVGSGVTRFNVGDRVVGHAVGPTKTRNTSAEGAFQIFTVLLAHMASPIPDTLSYESAAVIPLGLSTAACGLFEKDQLALPYPLVQHAKPTGKTLLIWGGSTSVGSNAIQLAIAAGFEVITTASPRNFEYVKKLGVNQVFDYNSKTINEELIRAFKGKAFGGALSIGYRAAEACLDIVDKLDGDKIISMATYPTPEPRPKTLVLLRTILYYLPASIALWFKSKTKGIRIEYIFASTLVDNGVGKAIYEEFLPGALAKGVFIAAPDPHIVGKGLEYIQPAMDLQKKGVSARKVVVSL